MLCYGKLFIVYLTEQRLDWLGAVEALVGSEDLIASRIKALVGWVATQQFRL